MGTIVKLRCPDGKFQYDFYEGVGFSLFRQQREARANMREGEWGDHWKKMIEQHPDGTATCRKVLCYCGKCKKYYSEPRIVFYLPKEGFKYESKDDNDEVSEYVIIENYEPIDKETMKCPDCGDTLDVIEDIKKASCPYCGKPLIMCKNFGHWD